MQQNPHSFFEENVIGLGRRVLLLVSTVACCTTLRAGDVLTLGDTPAATGTVTLSASSFHVDGTPSRDVNIADALEANFGDGPLKLQYFDSANVPGDKMPSDWATKTIDQALPSGSASFSGGKLTMTGDGGDLNQHKDHYFFAGIPWTGNGQWTAYFRQIGPATSNGSSLTEVIMTLRSGLDEGDTMFGMGVSDNGFLSMHNVGYRNLQAKFPLKLRITRFDKSLETSFLDDTNAWKVVWEDSAPLTDDFYVGFMINSHDKDNIGTAVIDQIQFTPTTAQPEVLPPGILLKSGTFLAGGTFRVTSDGGEVLYGVNSKIPYNYEDVAAAIYHPITMQQLTAVNSQAGALMLNGDFQAAAIKTIGATNGGGMVTLASKTNDTVAYYSDKVCAMSVNPLASKPSDYEIRLQNGSTIRASGFEFIDGSIPTVAIHEISLKTPIVVEPGDIAQIRAGETRVQPLLQVPWKGTGDFMSWAGPNQEQILVAPAGAKLLFPLKDKFQSVVMRTALAPGAAYQAQTTLTFTADGKPLGDPIILKNGDEPLAIHLPVSNPKSIMLSIDAAPVGTRVLLIDPVAIRANIALSTPSPKSASSTSQATTAPEASTLVPDKTPPGDSSAK